MLQALDSTHSVLEQAVHSFRSVRHKNVNKPVIINVLVMRE